MADEEVRRTDAADTIRKELPGKYFEGFRGKKLMQTYEGIAMQSQ